jgi:hypothetical protein
MNTLFNRTDKLEAQLKDLVITVANNNHTSKHGKSAEDIYVVKLDIMLVVNKMMDDVRKEIAALRSEVFDLRSEVLKRGSGASAVAPQPQGSQIQPE